MDNRNYNDNEYEYDWDEQYYGTGPTEPPKEHNGPMALMLILVIFLFGIITVLGVLNIKLFQELKLKRQEMDLSISLPRKPLFPRKPISRSLPKPFRSRYRISAP